MRYDHGPSRSEPSSPIVDLSAGRTRCTDVEPVMPKTTNATAASVGESRQEGRCCVVHAQNFALSEEEVDVEASVQRPRRAERASASEERAKRAMWVASAAEDGGRRRRGPSLPERRVERRLFCTTASKKIVAGNWSKFGLPERCE